MGKGNLLLDYKVIQMGWKADCSSVYQESSKCFEMQDVLVMV